MSTPASIPRPSVQVIEEFTATTPTAVLPTLVPCVVGPCWQVVEILTSTATGAQTLNSEALVQLQASLVAKAAVGSPPVYAGLDGLTLNLILNNGPVTSIPLTGDSLSPEQVVAEVLIAFAAANVTAFTAELVGTTQWRVRSIAADVNQTIEVATGTSVEVLSTFGFAVGKTTAGDAYYDNHITSIITPNFPDPNNNLSQVVIDPTTVSAFLFLGGSNLGSALFQMLGSQSFLQNGIGASAVVTGTVDLTTLTYGLGGTVDTLTLVLTFNGAASPLTVTFAAPANMAGLLSQINSVISAVATATANGSNFLVITTTLGGAAASLQVGAGTANTGLGLTQVTMSGTAGVIAVAPGSGQAVTNTLQFTGANFTASPTSAQVTGTVALTSVTDGLTLTLDDGDEPQTLIFSGASSSTLILAQINALFGAAGGGRILATVNGSTHLVLTDTALGVESIVKVVGGTALTALGLTVATVARGGPYVPVAGDELWIDGIDYATITQVAPGGNVNQLKINKSVPVSNNVGLAWYIEANNLNNVESAWGVTRPTPNLIVDPTGDITLKPEVLRDTQGNPIATVAAQIYIAYHGLREDVTAIADSPALLQFSDPTTLSNNLAPLTTDNPLGLGLYFALTNAPGVTVTGLGVDAVSEAQPFGTTDAWTRAAQFLEGYEVYGIAPMTHDPSVFSVLDTHVTFMSEPTSRGERIVLINGSIPTHANDTLVASGTNGNTTTTNNQFDTGVTNLGTLLVASSIGGVGPYTVDTGIYLDIGDGNHYSVINFIGSVVICQTSGFQPGENDDGFYATTSLPSPLIEEAFAIRVRGAPLVLPDGTPDKDTMALTLQQTAQGYANRRVWSVVPDTVSATINGILQQIDAFYFSAATVGMIGALVPQQSFTNYPVTGFAGVTGSNGFFSESQLDVIAGGGNYIIVQDAPTQPLICRMALTTDVSSIETRTDIIVKTVDYTAKFLRTLLQNYIGRFNISQAFLDSLSHVINGGLAALEDLGVMSGDLQSIIQDTTEEDRVLAELILDPPIPCNYIQLTLAA